MVTKAVVIKWNQLEYQKFMRDPTGPLAEELLTKLAEVVLEGAKRRAEVRTGKMRDEMKFDIGTDEIGLYARISSPARSKTGFPYAIVHEGKKVRDRRPHRSLKPALRDIRKVLKG